MIGNIINTLYYIVVDKAKCNASDTTGRDNGFGSNYIWAATLQSGLNIAKAHRKPVMVIIHKSWCTACKNFKPRFAASDDIFKLSKNFVMINLIDDDEPPQLKYAPDGTYIPRILFLSDTGQVLKEVFNEMGNQHHKYFYSRPEQVVASMKKVAQMYGCEI